MIMNQSHDHKLDIYIKTIEDLKNQLAERERAYDKLEREHWEILDKFEEYLELGRVMEKLPELILTQIKKISSTKAKKAADALHSKPGGSRDKKAEIQSVWASGKYANRDLCAEQECAAIGMSFSVARKALRNTPDPAYPLQRTA